MAATTPLASDLGLTLSLGGAATVGERSLCVIGGRQADAGVLETLARLYVEGHKPDIRPLFPAVVSRVPLPTYPFERKTFVFDSPTDGVGEEAEEIFATQVEPPFMAGAAVQESICPVMDTSSFVDEPDLFGNTLLDELKRINWPLELEEQL